MNKCCKTCRLWNYAQATDKKLGKIIFEIGCVHKDNVARCLWQSTEIWPESVGWSNKRPEPRYMSPADGSDCPCWIERKP